MLSSSVEVFIREILTGQAIGDLADLFVDLVELLLEVGNFVCFNVLGLIFHGLELFQSIDFIFVSLHADADLLVLHVE